MKLVLQAALPGRRLVLIHFNAGEVPFNGEEYKQRCVKEARNLYPEAVSVISLGYYEEVRSEEALQILMVNDSVLGAYSSAEKAIKARVQWENKNPKPDGRYRYFHQHPYRVDDDPKFS